MTLNDKAYKFFKWAVLTVLPALSVLVGILGKAYGWDGTDLAVITLNAVAVFLGAATGVSALNYNKENNNDSK